MAACTWRCLVCAVLAASGPPTGGDPPAAGPAWERLFSAPAPQEADIDAVLAACAHRVERVKALIDADVAYPQMKPGWHRRSTEVADGKKVYPVEFMVRVPRGYRPHRPHPLLLAAHGQHSSGAAIGRMMERLLGADVEKYLLLAPTLPGPRHVNGRAYQEQSYLKPLRWAKTHLNVDDDRVYVSGYSQGGHISWHMAMLHPHLFAAAVPMAGIPWFEGSPYTSTAYAENLGNLPVWAIWGELDKKGPGILSNVHFARMAARRLAELGNKNFKGTELPGVGHGGCWCGSAEFARYLAAHARTPVPQEVAHFFHSRRHGRGYYLQAEKLTRPEPDFTRRLRVPIRLGPGKKPTARDVIDAGKRHYDKLLFRMWARLDRAGNALAVRASGVGEVRIHVTEGMFDLGRAVTLRFGDRSWTGRIAPSARCVLSHYAAGRDGAAVVYNEVRLDSAGQGTVVWQAGR